MSKYEFIHYDVENRVARITLARPHYRNAQSRRLLEELDSAFALAGDDDQVRAVVLLGEGDHFSAGHDLGTPEEMADRDERPREEGIRGWYKWTYDTFYANTLRWRNVPKPTVAAVQGYCIFGGWMIASAMDVIFAADDAMFLGSHYQYFAMPWDIHPRKVKELLYESRFIDADEALALGLVNRIYPRANLRSEAIEWCERVAENDPFRMRMTKSAVNHAEDTQGFGAHTSAAHAFYVLARVGEDDPAAPKYEIEGRQRPMVGTALENYKRLRDKR
ncbi:MAG: enoyl-CoA hydratase/isomerase family protein [Gammaproteobacteria bacterium]|nr:enoyl-CoA hydratase/isomerase family protein [Gammaproteobacteria bacterium]